MFSTKRLEIPPAYFQFKTSLKMTHQNYWKIKNSTFSHITDIATRTHPKKNIFKRPLNMGWKITYTPHLTRQEQKKTKVKNHLHISKRSQGFSAV